MSLSIQPFGSIPRPAPRDPPRGGGRGLQHWGLRGQRLISCGAQEDARAGRAGPGRAGVPRGRGQQYTANGTHALAMQRVIFHGCCRELSPRPRCAVGQKAGVSGMFPPPESLNSARIERMIPPMDCSSNEESIDGVIRSIQHYLTTLEVETCPEFLPPAPVSGPLCGGHWAGLSQRQASRPKRSDRAKSRDFNWPDVSICSVPLWFSFLPRGKAGEVRPNWCAASAARVGLCGGPMH